MSDLVWSVTCLDDDDAVAHQAAQHVVQVANAAIAERGVFDFAVSGGRTPWVMFDHLAHLDMPWELTRIFQVDERIAPVDDPARNLLHLRQALSGTAADVHPMPVEDSDPQEGAQRYADELPERFDLIHLGLGPDGHTASLVPGDAILQVRDRDVAITDQAYQGHRRMSLTYPVLDRARRLMWLVTGAEKHAALVGLLDHDPSIPAGRVQGVDNLVVCDEAARSGAIDPA